MQDWLEGKVDLPPEFLMGRDAIVWSREYSRKAEAHCKCAMLQETLQRLHADRMVVGHTIQSGGINGACSHQVLPVCCHDSLPTAHEACSMCRRDRQFSSCASVFRGTRMFIGNAVTYRL